jgi:hypothetical protein
VGFLKDLRKTVDKAKELEESSPSAKDRMAQGLETMKAMNETGAGMVAAMDPSKPSNTLQAQVVAVRDLQAQITYQPLLEIDLLVSGATGAKYPVTLHQPVPHSVLSRIQPGATVPVRVSVDDPQAVYLLA